MKRVLCLAPLLALTVFLAVPAASGSRGSITIQEYAVPQATWEGIRAEWVDGLKSRYPSGAWAPLRFEPTDSQLARLGLPPQRILGKMRFPEPTMVDRFGNRTRVKLPIPAGPNGTLGPTVTSFAGAGWFGIRPGAFLLLINAGSIGWCSMAHVYGSPGAYSISTAGHCGKVGHIGTVIAALGNRSGVLNPILLDFGKFSSSTDGGLGNDYAKISVDSAWQGLVSPTMAFWGGPRGVFTKTGGVATVTIPRNNIIPKVAVNTDPFLAQTIVHYGHGAGVGTGGTPRAAEVIHWGTTHFMFFGAITPGDSGSGANTLLGDTVGANMEAAGIMTHLYIDPLMRQGLGIMGGTRTTKVGTPANGQIVPYPVPAPGLP